MANLFSQFKSVMYKNYGENPGKMLVHTGVLGGYCQQWLRLVLLFLMIKFQKSKSRS